MGVNLKPLFESTKIGIDQLKGRKLAVDAFNIIYQFLTSIRQRDGAPLMDSHDNVTSHLTGLFYRNIHFLEAGLKPIYVFDGEPPCFKHSTIEVRAERKERARVKYEEAKHEGSFEKMKMYAQQTAVINAEIIEESKQLLTYLGIPIVQAVTEGEAQAAQMVAKGKADASVSQDFDSLLFGSLVLIRNLSVSGRRKLPRKNDYVMVFPEIIKLKPNLDRLGITREKLIWLGVLVGTDYNQGIKGIGPKTGLKLVKEYDDFDKLQRFVEDKYGMGLPYNIDVIIEYFKNPPYNDQFELRFRKPDKEKVIEMLSDRHDFSKDRIEKGLSRLEKAVDSRISQKTLF